MIKTHKRQKTSRIRGARTCGWGFRQKHKGPGNRGGKGMAGSGKRADHKKQKARESDTSNRKQYFGKQGVTSRNTFSKREDKMNLSTIKENLFKKDGQRIELKDYVILGNGEGFKAEIIAKRASASAIEKMNKAGGEIILPVKKEKQVQDIKKEEVEDKKEATDKEEKKEVKKVKEEKPKKAVKEKKEKKVVKK